MATRADAQRGIERVMQRAETRDTEWGFLGIYDPADNLYIFHIPEKPGYVHCMIENGLALEYAECIVRVALDPNVRCKFRKINGVLVAVEFDPQQAAQIHGANAPALGVPSFPLPDSGAVFPPPVFGDPEVKILDAGVASAGDDRFIVLAAETGTTDDCIELEGLEVGDEAWLFADTGDTITLKHNDAGATDKFLFYNETDITLTGSKGLKVVKKASGAVVNSVDEGGGGAFTDLTDVPSSYTGQAGKVVAVKGDETGLEFVTSGAGDIGAKLRRVGTVLHDETLGSAGSFDVTSISQDYDDLEIIIEGRSSANSSGGVNNVNVTLNNDTTDANYLFQQVQGTGTTANASSTAGRLLAAVPGADATASREGLARIFIPDYTAAIFKEVQSLVSAHNTTNFAIFRSYAWQNTAAINRVTVTVSNATTTFEAGTRLRIIGWVTEPIGGLDTSNANVSSPPTDAELDSAFGTPAAVGDGFMATINDNGADTAQWLVISNGTSWWYASLTKAT